MFTNQSALGTQLSSVATDKDATERSSKGGDKELCVTAFKMKVELSLYSKVGDAKLRSEALSHRLQWKEQLKGLLLFNKMLLPLGKQKRKVFICPDKKF